MDTKSTRNKFFKDIGTFIFLILLIFFSISLIGTVREHRNFKSNFGDTLFDNNLIVSEVLELDTVLKEYTVLYLDLDGNKKENVYNKRIEESNSYKENSIREVENNIREEAKESNLSEEEIKKQIEEVRASIMSEDGVDNYYSQVMNSANNIIYKNINIEFFFKDSSGAKVTNIEDNNIEDEIDNNAFLNNEDYYYMYLPSSKLKVNNTFYSNELIDIYNSIRHSNDNVSRFYRIPKELKQGDLLYNISLEREEASSILYKKIAVTAVFGALTLIFAFVAFRNRKNKTTSYIEDLYNKLPIDLRTLVFVYSLVLINSLIFNVIPYYGNNYYCNSILLKSCILIVLDYYFIKDLILILEKKRTIGKILIFKIYKYILNIIKSNEFIKTNKFKVSFIIIISLLAIISSFVPLLWPWAYSMISYSRLFLFIYIILSALFSLNIFNEIRILESNTLRIAKGNYKDDLKEDNILILKNIENNLNTIEDGLKGALDKAITSEKMKSELITNVSHDLKTPLTSIINYVDLLKEENITEDKRARYIEVLDMKSKRLKILIEDLFEASKAVSGTMNFQKEDLNIVSLLRQVIGELEEKISEANLNIVTKWPEERIILYLDGRKTYRVYENLLNNIIKYSMDGSRVYIEVISNDDEIIITMKNISAYQIDFSSEEIVERFKRGDKSRSTEGSGLGLSIAKSIVELQGGDFKIEIDGDLFKVITKFKKNN